MSRTNVLCEGWRMGMAAMSDKEKKELQIRNSTVDFLVFTAAENLMKIELVHFLHKLRIMEKPTNISFIPCLPLSPSDTA